MDVSKKVHTKVPTTIKGMDRFPDLQSGAIFRISAHFGWWSRFIQLLWNRITNHQKKSKWRKYIESAFWIAFMHVEADLIFGLTLGGPSPLSIWKLSWQIPKLRIKKRGGRGTVKRSKCDITYRQWCFLTELLLPRQMAAPTVGTGETIDCGL